MCIAGLGSFAKGLSKEAKADVEKIETEIKKWCKSQPHGSKEERLVCFSFTQQTHMQLVVRFSRSHRHSKLISCAWRRQRAHREQAAGSQMLALGIVLCSKFRLLLAAGLEEA